jgi:putative SOS response-associated peptidase YedK
MCGRFSLSTPGEILAEAFGLQDPPQLEPRHNIAPTQTVATIRSDEGGRRSAHLCRWGLVPAWAKGTWRRGPLINARSETVERMPAFRDAFGARRCLVPADAFYEWKALPGSKRKQPFLIRMADGDPFALAGLWEPATETAGAVETCTILTTEPNTLVRGIHDRMPVILEPESYRLWLDPAARVSAPLRALLRPFPEERMLAYPVSTRVNNPRNDDPACAEPLETSPP